MDVYMYCLALYNLYTKYTMYNVHVHENVLHVQKYIVCIISLCTCCYSQVTVPSKDGSLASEGLGVVTTPTTQSVAMATTQQPTVQSSRNHPSSTQVHVPQWERSLHIATPYIHLNVLFVYFSPWNEDSLVIKTVARVSWKYLCIAH